MKIKSLVYAGLGALAMSAPAFAQSSVNQHNVTLNLKVFFEGPVQEKETESSSKYTYTEKSKFVVGKFSNKEFLLELVEAGVISDIKGWSVVLLVDQGGNVISLFITKSGQSPIEVSEFLSYDLDEVVEAWDYKEVQYSNGDYEETDKWTERGKSRVWIETPNLCASLRGGYTGNLQSSYFSTGELGKALPEGYYEKTTGGTIESLVGSGSYGEEEENNETVLKGSSEESGEQVLLEGTIGLGAPKLVSFSESNPD